MSHSTPPRSAKVLGKATHSYGDRKGVVLLLVLAAIVVIGSALVQVARSNTEAQIAVAGERVALQQRWGMLSCQRAVLPAAQGAFFRSDAVTGQGRANKSKFPHQLADQVQLGTQTFDLILADEDAKANLNVVYDLGGESAVQRLLGDVLAIADRRAVQLRPIRSSLSVSTALDSQQNASRLGLDGADEDDDPDLEDLDLRLPPPAMDSWGKVFDYRAVNQFAGDLRQIAKSTRDVTLWGSGRLNVWRASDEAIIAVCRDVAQDGLAKRIQQRIRSSSLSQVDLVLRQTVTNEQDRQKLSGLLADSSQCASLWIEANDGNLRRQQLSILIQDETGLTRTVGFELP